MSSRDLAVKVAANKVLMDHAKTQYDQARAEMSARMERGDRVMAVAPNGVKIAAVSKKDPKPHAGIVDMPAFRAWVAKHYPERIVTTLEIVGAPEEVKEVLMRHAPALLKQSDAVEPDFVRTVLNDSTKHGRAVGPGGEVEIPGVQVEHREGVVACVPTDEAMGVVIEMLQSGELDLLDVLPVGGGE
ncbi:hypothetical protein [Amycolatopsis thermoflava]|uniref:hypothetical protein n=1 Tax=Amycolatopsis thermoflava TaxID=84480 RepID=UPI0003F749D6|nr:hypothetical protein [Amycolatopsis thermoflava]